jgi:hypothetical protein
MNRRLLTHSEVACYERCPREWYFRYHLRRRPASESRAIVFGKIFDEALQAWWTAGPLTGRDAMLARLSEIVSGMKTDPFEVAKARALLLGYDARWANEPYEILRVQPIFQMNFGAFALGGKLDVLVRDVKTDEIVIIETKTTSLDISRESAYWHAVTTLDPQISTYWKGARLILEGKEAQRCVYDVARKPGLRPLQVNAARSVAETPDEYFERCANEIVDDPNKYYARRSIVRLERDESEHSQDLCQIATIMHDNEKQNRFPRYLISCRRFGEMCAYFPVCSGATTIDTYPIAIEKHEELKVEV